MSWDDIVQVIVKETLPSIKRYWHSPKRSNLSSNMVLATASRVGAFSGLLSMMLFAWHQQGWTILSSSNQSVIRVFVCGVAGFIGGGFLSWLGFRRGDDGSQGVIWWKLLPAIVGGGAVLSTCQVMSTMALSSNKVLEIFRHSIAWYRLPVTSAYFAMGGLGAASIVFLNDPRNLRGIRDGLVSAFWVAVVSSMSYCLPFVLTKLLLGWDAAVIASELGATKPPLYWQDEDFQMTRWFWLTACTFAYYAPILTAIALRSAIGSQSQKNSKGRFRKADV